jgi:diacylglycerol O-acyltransferase
MDNTLEFLDQAAFLRLRATGNGSVVHCTWIYDRAVDVNELHQFHHHLGRGLLGRRIERSPLIFGRHRWVQCHGSPDIDFAGSLRPRGDIGAWVDQRTQIPVDPEFGPGWHLGVLGLEEGGTAVSVVASHCLVDGLGLGIAIAEAVKGQDREFGYPRAHSRTRMRALLADGREFVRGLREVLRALIACIPLLLARRSDRPSAPTRRPAPHSDHEITLPTLTMRTEAASWDARARALGGSSTSLFIAFAARLAQAMGRVHLGDGAVTVTVPVGERAPDDTRANALTSMTFTLDPDGVTNDLNDVRNKVKHGLTGLQQTPNELLAPLPLIPLVPKWLARQAEGLAMGSAELPVGCSNLGDLDPLVGRIDGTDADGVYLGLADQRVSSRSIERAHGQLFLGSGRINEARFVTVVAYQPGADNSKRYLRELAQRTLADFGLTATMDH